MPLRLFLVPLLATVAWSVTGCESFEPAPEPAQRRVLFEMRAKLASLPEGEEFATIWMPTPLVTPLQRCSALQLEGRGGEVEQHFDALGNDVVSIRGTPDPSRPLEIYYKVEVTRDELRAPRTLVSDGALPATSPWLVPARRAHVPGLSRRALELTGHIGSIDGRVLALWQHTLDTLQHSPPPPDRLAESRYGMGDLPWILEAKLGNSIDYATFFVAFHQAAGIPASFELGYLLPANERLEAYRPAQVHAWARLELPELGWLPFDPAMAEREPGRRQAYFGGLDADRILMSRGRDLQLNPPIEGEPLNWFGSPIAQAGKHDLSAQLDVEIRIQDL